MIKLTIVITSYNYGHFLEEALLSILKQSGPYEVVAVDDGSTDNSREIIVRLAKDFAALRYHFHKKNQGPQGALNTGFKLAKGEYIHFFASDDLYFPHTLKTLFSLFDDYPEAPLFWSDIAYFSQSSPIRVRRLLNQSETAYLSPQAILQLFQTTNLWIPGHTIVAKRKIYARYMPYQKALGSTCDWLINHTLALTHGGVYVPKALFAMRQHSDSYSASASFEIRRKAWKNLLNVLESSPEKYHSLTRSGILRMIGLKTIYKDLLLTPRYWKYLMPMLTRELRKRKCKPLQEVALQLAKDGTALGCSSGTAPFSQQL